MNGDEYMKRKKRKIKKERIIFLILIFIVVGGLSYFMLTPQTNHIEEYQVDGLSIQHQFLTINPYSRSGKPLNKVKGIVIHYTGNPNSTAQNNRDYFENLKNKHTTYASSHFIIGLKGEVIQCIPLNEISYASNNRNKDTISIECCHPDESGQFTEETYNSLQKLVQSLSNTYQLNHNDIIRHYDVTGKICPKYFVENEDAWNNFLNSIH